MDGSSKTLANTGSSRGMVHSVAGSLRSMVQSVAISSDGRLVAAGGFDSVRDLQSFGGVYSEHSSYRW